MRYRILALPVAGAIVLAACAAPAPAPTTGTPADEATLRGMSAKYADAFNRGDAAGIAALVTDDFESVGPDGTVIKGRAALEAADKAQMAQAQAAGLKLTLTANTSIVRFTSANSAAIGGTWTMAGVPPGMGAEKGAWSGTALKGSDGTWRLATSLVSDYVPPPAPPAPTPTPSKGK